MAQNVIHPTVWRPWLREVQQAMLKVTISNERQRRQFSHGGGPLEFGRGPRRDLERFIIEDRFVSRDQLRVEEVKSAQVKIEVLGSAATLASGEVLPTGTVRLCDLPLRITCGYTLIEIALEATDPSGGVSLQTISRPMQSLVGRAPPATLSEMGESPSPETLAQWFETLLTVQRAAAGSGEFYDETARAAVELVGLDRGLVLLRKNLEWEVAASHTTNARLGGDFSRKVLNGVLADKRTFFQGLDESNWSQSLVGVESVVASPIFDERRNVIGVVYGSRDLRTSLARRGISPLEAQLIQLLAGAVSAGLARVEREAEAARNRVQFEQFCSPELARALEQNPSLLEGHEREVTVMFCDLRGFSRIAERIGTSKSYSLLGDVMDRMTNRIIDHGGVIIDYYGDGLAAMWNAPANQADHAARACRAAQAMWSDVPEINRVWAPVVEAPLKIGVGINTGPAQVGNAGSRRRLKYGPRGHTVNLASRVEGATKRFGVPVLISGATRGAIGPEFGVRRLCLVRVVGISNAVELFELCLESPDPLWLARRDAYEQALTCYETGNCADAVKLLEAFTARPNFSEDVPAQVLLAKATAQARLAAGQFDSVFELDVK
jgi:adenylate cyclase